jgi:hypothetical protein
MQGSTTVSALLVKDDFVLMTASNKTPPMPLSIVWPNSDRKPY